MPPELAEFQSDFAAALDRPASGAMAVYRNTVVHGAVEALRANYPVVEQILGSEMFEHVAVDFASTCPPRTPVLALYGSEFADWLLHQPWIDDLAYLADVARVERLRVACLFGAEAEPLCASDVRLARHSPDARLILHPAAQFAWLQSPAMSIWLAHQRPVASEIAPDWKAEGALFARPRPFTVHALRIGRAAHHMLSGISLGESVSGSIAAAAHLYPGEDSTAVFESLVHLGLFVGPAYERKL
ncbi:MAG: putative DNA-binding domain-containing protein [Sphingomicrobium sp.]